MELNVCKATSGAVGERSYFWKDAQSKLGSQVPPDCHLVPVTQDHAQSPRWPASTATAAQGAAQVTVSA